MQSTMETLSLPVACTSLVTTYLQFPVAEKYKIICHLLNFQTVSVHILDSIYCNASAVPVQVSNSFFGINLSKAKER